MNPINKLLRIYLPLYNQLSHVSAKSRILLFQRDFSSTLCLPKPNIYFKILELSYFFPCYSISSNLQPSVFLYSKASGVSGVVIHLDIYIRLSMYLTDGGGGGCSSSCALVLFSAPYAFSMQYCQQPRKMTNLLLCCLSSGADEQKAGVKYKTKPLILSSQGGLSYI